MCRCTYETRSPEVVNEGFQQDSYDLEKLDAFSIGVIIHCILYKKFIVSRETQLSDEESIEWIRREHDTREISYIVSSIRETGLPPGVPRDVFEVMLSLLDANPETRWTISRCLDHLKTSIVEDDDISSLGATTPTTTMDQDEDIHLIARLTNKDARVISKTKVRKFVPNSTGRSIIWLTDDCLQIFMSLLDHPPTPDDVRACFVMAECLVLREPNFSTSFIKEHDRACVMAALQSISRRQYFTL